MLYSVSQQQKNKQVGRYIPTEAGLDISFTTTDNLESRVIVELGRFRTWAGPDENLWLGEFGIPNDRSGGEQIDWNRILEIAVDKCICDNIAFTYWASGHEWGTTYNLSPYESSTANPGGVWSDTPIGATLDAAIAKAQGKIPFVGVCYAGHEFGTSEQDPTAAPSQADFEWHHDKGVRVIRYALGEPSWTTDWMYIPTTDSWRDSDIQHVENVLNNAALAGIQVILDILHPGGGAKYATIGGASLANATNYNYYVAYATKLLNHTMTDHNSNSITLKNHSALYGVDMVNEPQTLGSGGGNSWLTISQDLVDDFRDVAKINYQGRLFVGLPHYSGIQDVNNNAPAGPWITDPQNNFFYEGHLYPESNHVGNFTGSYADNVSSSGSFSGQGNFSCSV